MDVASSVYLVMDRSMLGYITGDDGEVGLYAAAIKIASVLTSFLRLFGPLCDRELHIRWNGIASRLTR